MKNTLLLIAILLSISCFSQTYNVSVKSGDVIKIRKNNTTVITLPTAGVADSNYQFTLIVQKKNTTSVNKPPVVSAGSSQTIILPVNAITLQGTATDPDGTVSSVIWNNATSNLQANIVTPASVTTTVTDLVQGSYIFKLTATDNKGASVTASVTIAVAGLQPPPDTSGISYQGFGKDAIGGSQSTNVYHVINTNSSGSGSLANGIGSNKTILFDVSGTIVGRFDLINISYLTIDGNGKDVTINNNVAGDGISFDGANTHHCILKGVRVYNAGMDGINVIDGAHDILITNCTSYGNRDGNIDIAGDNAGQTKNVTVQYCIIGGGAPGDKSYSGSTLVTAQNVSLHHNLYIPNSPAGGVAERCPFVHSNYSPVGSPNCDFRNNLVSNWGRYATGFGYKTAVNIVNNYYNGSGSGAIDPNADPSGNTASYYVAGNVQSNGANINLNGGNHSEYQSAGITTTDAKTAARAVLSKAGTAVKSNAFGVNEQSVINAIVIQ